MNSRLTPLQEVAYVLDLTPDATSGEVIQRIRELEAAANTAPPPVPVASKRAGRKSEGISPLGEALLLLSYGGVSLVACAALASNIFLFLLYFIPCVVWSIWITTGTVRMMMGEEL